MSDEQVPLYNLCLSQTELDSLLEQIRSSSYIDEVESGEVPREESSLWNTIEPVKDPPQDTSLESLIKHAKGRSALVIVQEKDMKSVLIVQLSNGVKKEEMKVAPKDVLEVCSNLTAGGMGLSDFKSMAKNADIFDSGR